MYIMTLASKGVEISAQSFQKFSEFFFMRTPAKDTDEKSLAKSFVKSFVNLISQLISPLAKEETDFFQLRIMRDEKIVNVKYAQNTYVQFLPQ